MEHAVRKSYVIWTTIWIITFKTIINVQEKWNIDIKTKIIERKSKNIIWVWVRMLSEKLLKNNCINIISLLGILVGAE